MILEKDSLAKDGREVHVEAGFEGLRAESIRVDLVCVMECSDDKHGSVSALEGV